MTVLPYPPRRAWLRAFLLVMTIPLTAAVVASSILLSPRIVVALLPVAALIVLGWCRPSILRIAYRVWRGLALRVERLFRFAVLFAAYYGVIVPAGSRHSGLALERPAVGESLWEPYPASDRAAYFHPDAAGTDGPRSAGWVVRYARWATTSGNAWMLGLLPFLWLLSRVDATEALGDVPTDIYTLA